MEFLITGRVRERESQRPVPNLLVRAFDKDLFFSDLLGNAVTNSQGTFSIGYEGKDFQELFDRRPDIYLVIYGSATAQDPGRTGDQPIYTTKCVRFHAGHKEHFEIQIPREQLGADAPSEGTIRTPEPGEWKGLLDDYIATHPQYEPQKGFAAPKLECTSNFAPEIAKVKKGDSGWVTVRVSNRGNGISFSAYVQVYDGPIGYNHPLRDYRLCDYQIETINPGQTVDVKLYWTRQDFGGKIVGVCFDPFLDPRGFQLVEQYHPHITQMSYYNPLG